MSSRISLQQLQQEPTGSAPAAAAPENFQSSVSSYAPMPVAPRRSNGSSPNTLPPTSHSGKGEGVASAVAEFPQRRPSQGTGVSPKAQGRSGAQTGPGRLENRTLPQPASPSSGAAATAAAAGEGGEEGHPPPQTVLSVLDLARPAAAAAAARETDERRGGSAVDARSPTRKERAAPPLFAEERGVKGVGSTPLAAGIHHKHHHHNHHRHHQNHDDNKNTNANDNTSGGGGAAAAASAPAACRIAPSGKTSPLMPRLASSQRAATTHGSDIADLPSPPPTTGADAVKVQVRSRRVSGGKAGGDPEYGKMAIPPPPPLKDGKSSASPPSGVEAEERGRFVHHAGHPRLPTAAQPETHRRGSDNSSASSLSSSSPSLLPAQDRPSSSFSAAATSSSTGASKCYSSPKDSAMSGEVMRPISHDDINESHTADGRGRKAANTMSVPQPPTALFRGGSGRRRRRGSGGGSPKAAGHSGDGSGSRPGSEKGHGGAYRGRRIVVRAAAASDEAVTDGSAAGHTDSATSPRSDVSEADAAVLPLPVFTADVDTAQRDGSPTSAGGGGRRNRRSSGSSRRVPSVDCAGNSSTARPSSKDSARGGGAGAASSPPLAPQDGAAAGHDVDGDGNSSTTTTATTARPLSRRESSLSLRQQAALQRTPSALSRLHTPPPDTLRLEVQILGRRRKRPAAVTYTADGDDGEEVEELLHDEGHSPASPRHDDGEAGISSSNGEVVNTAGSTPMSPGTKRFTEGDGVVDADSASAGSAGCISSTRPPTATAVLHSALPAQLTSGATPLSANTDGVVEDEGENLQRGGILGNVRRDSGGGFVPFRMPLAGSPAGVRADALKGATHAPQPQEKKADVTTAAIPHPPSATRVTSPEVGGGASILSRQQQRPHDQVITRATPDGAESEGSNLNVSYSLMEDDTTATAGRGKQRSIPTTSPVKRQRTLNEGRTTTTAAAAQPQPPSSPSPTLPPRRPHSLTLPAEEPPARETEHPMEAAAPFPPTTPTVALGGNIDEANGGLSAVVQPTPASPVAAGNSVSVSYSFLYELKEGGLNGGGGGGGAAAVPSSSATPPRRPPGRHGHDAAATEAAAAAAAADASTTSSPPLPGGFSARRGSGASSHSSGASSRRHVDMAASAASSANRTPKSPYLEYAQQKVLEHRSNAPQQEEGTTPSPSPRHQPIRSSSPAIPAAPKRSTDNTTKMTPVQPARRSSSGQHIAMAAAAAAAAAAGAASFTAPVATEKRTTTSASPFHAPTVPDAIAGIHSDAVNGGGGDSDSDAGSRCGSSRRQRQRQLNAIFDDDEDDIFSSASSLNSSYGSLVEGDAVLGAGRKGNSHSSGTGGGGAAQGRGETAKKKATARAIKQDLASPTTTTTTATTRTTATAAAPAETSAAEYLVTPPTPTVPSASLTPQRQSGHVDILVVGKDAEPSPAALPSARLNLNHSAADNDDDDDEEEGEDEDDEFDSELLVGFRPDGYGARRGSRVRSGVTFFLNRLEDSFSASDILAVDDAAPSQSQNAAATRCSVGGGNPRPRISFAAYRPPEGSALLVAKEAAAAAAASALRGVVRPSSGLRLNGRASPASSPHSNNASATAAANATAAHKNETTNAGSATLRGGSGAAAVGADTSLFDVHIVAPSLTGGCTTPEPDTQRLPSAPSSPASGPSAAAATPPPPLTTTAAGADLQPQSQSPSGMTHCSSLSSANFSNDTRSNNNINNVQKGSTPSSSAAAGPSKKGKGSTGVCSKSALSPSSSSLSAAAAGGARISLLPSPAVPGILIAAAFPTATPATPSAVVLPASPSCGLQQRSKYAPDPAKIHRPIANTFGTRNRRQRQHDDDDDDDDDDDGGDHRKRASGSGRNRHSPQQQPLHGGYGEEEDDEEEDDDGEYEWCWEEGEEDEEEEEEEECAVAVEESDSRVPPPSIRAPSSRRHDVQEAGGGDIEDSGEIVFLVGRAG